MSLQDQVNNAINKGTNATTLAAGLYDKVSQTGKRFGLFKTEQPNQDTKKVAKDTGIRPLDDFISEVKNDGLARHNHFSFEFTPPFRAYVQGGDRDPHGQLRRLQLLCAGVNLPSVHQETTQMRTYGEMYEMPNQKTYGTLHSTFYVDKRMNVKKLFDQWADVVQDPVSREYNFYDKYVSKDVWVKVYDRNGYPHYALHLRDAYPKTIDDIQLTHGNHDIMTVGITWSYRTWTSHLINNPLTPTDGPVGTQVQPTLRERLMGYVGNFKDYQDRFNNLSGDLGRAEDMVKEQDWGGFVGQNFGGGVW